MACHHQAIWEFRSHRDDLEHRLGRRKINKFRGKNTSLHGSRRTNGRSNHNKLEASLEYYNYGVSSFTYQSERRPTSFLLKGPCLISTASPMKPAQQPNTYRAALRRQQWLGTRRIGVATAVLCMMLSAVSLPPCYLVQLIAISLTSISLRLSDAGSRKSPEVFQT
ncbi:hypothetical protein F4777DRAFT_42119 [Nemania sp. FL0916]|nr:hypothetical protein F4777DRAFT_42119 [Nemania sp. FL0916]